MAKKGKPIQVKGLLSSLSFGGAASLVVVLLVLGALSLVVDPARLWILTLFGLIYPLSFLVGLVLFVWSLFRKSKMRLPLAIALLPSLFFVGRYYQFSAPKNPPEPSLSVVSYNVGLFAHGPSGMSREALADSVATYLRGTGADIICLQEFRLPSGVDFSNWLSRRLPGYEPVYYSLQGRTSSFGNVILSRFPVKGHGKVSFEHSTNMALWADIGLPGGTIRLFNCHFESYNISIPRMVKGIQDEEVVEETSRKMKRSITERPKQVNVVLQEVQKAPYGSIVLGDFNDTPLSYTYVRLLQGRKDSFVEAGKGFGASFSTLWPLLRIDYILYPDELEASAYKVQRRDYSDHYPIFASYYESRGNNK